MRNTLLLTGLTLGLASQAVQAAPQTVDIMVLYTQGATANRSGKDIDARIASYIEYANTAYAKSGVDLRLRLVHKQLLNWAQYPDVTDSNLDRFKSDTQVQRLREQYGADVVSLINLAADAGNGYITCGIGYMGSGDKNTDRFYSWAKDVPYNLVGVDCGLNTFAHEAGHNMGLRHSYEQDQQEGYGSGGGHSGTHEWSRGYGVNGQFSTIMAYPHVFNARTQAPFFSSPKLVNAECSNQPCGMNGRADAVRALNSMAVQIAGFRATKVPDTSNPNTPGTTPPVIPPVTPTLPWCAKTAAGGLLANGEFKTLDGWRALFNQADLSLVNVATACRDNAVQLDSRGFDLLATPVSGLRSGAQYRLSGKVMLKAKGSRENVRLAILTESSTGGFAYAADQTVSLSVTGNEFSRLEKSFTFKPAADTRTLYVAVWSDSGSSLLADELSLTEVTATPPTVPPVPPVPTRVMSDFENGIAGWAGMHGSVRPSSFARGGRQALESYNRVYDGSGVTTSLVGNVTAGQRYRMNADVALGRDNRVSGLVYAYLYVETAGSPGRYLSLGQRTVQGGTWVNLQADVQLPTGTLKRVDLLILGNQRAQSLFIDNVAFSKQ
ncbi:MAG: zinc-dependent metalloprotease family protein [Pseudomonas sp.]|uniref:zinc-dependent metalloprotease family protein n=1 Tax=Pseudomonas sp. TaxID=306 RepID=UPI003396D3DB